MAEVYRTFIRMSNDHAAAAVSLVAHTDIDLVGGERLSLAQNRSLAFYTRFHNYLSGRAYIHSATIARILPTPTEEATLSLGFPQFFSHLGKPIPPQSALLLSTATFPPSPRRRSRVYVPFLAQAFVTDGKLREEWQDLFRDQMRAVYTPSTIFTSSEIANITSGLVSRVDNTFYPLSDPVFLPQTECRREIATQRRRSRRTAW